jgi:K+-transporting ATPase KdpF subunit
MAIDTMIFVVVGAALFTYLLYALLRPERF